ncbi:MAG TPA: hypothetical protein VFA45_20995 [Actinomycetes bacterium]|nr:hypothetical protein [Actinomycetes bacterium]
MTERQTLWSAALDPADHAALDPGVPDDLDSHPDVLVIGGGVTDLDVAGGGVVRVRTTAGELRPGTVVLATGLAPEPRVRLPQRRSRAT